MQTWKVLLHFKWGAIAVAYMCSAKVVVKKPAAIADVLKYPAVKIYGR